MRLKTQLRTNLWQPFAISLWSSCIVLGGAAFAQAKSPTAAPQGAQGGALSKVEWGQIPLKTIGGKDFKSQSLLGKTILVVNTASKCGYTPQFKGLQELYQKYQPQGLVVLGFPSDDFNQDPGTEKEIAKFCEVNYGVKFPLMAKGKVKGVDAQPLFKTLSQLAPDKGAVQWNFEKFLVNKDGKVLARFRSADGMDAIEPKIVAALK
jgi:glutathione peroxidase